MSRRLFFTRGKHELVLAERVFPSLRLCRENGIIDVVVEKTTQNDRAYVRIAENSVAVFTASHQRRSLFGVG